MDVNFQSWKCAVCHGFTPLNSQWAGVLKILQCINDNLGQLRVILPLGFASVSLRMRTEEYFGIVLDHLTHCKIHLLGLLSLVSTACSLMVTFLSMLHGWVFSSVSVTILCLAADPFTAFSFCFASLCSLSHFPFILICQVPHSEDIPCHLSAHNCKSS